MATDKEHLMKMQKNRKRKYEVEESEIKGLYDVTVTERGEVINKVYRLIPSLIGRYISENEEMNR